MKKLILYLLLFFALLFYLLRYREILKEPLHRKLFIIGASTVRYDLDKERMGWGTALIEHYMKFPQSAYNEARRGATAEGYKEMNDLIKKEKGPAYWGGTKALIKHLPKVAGSYLLIQFGANDKIQKIPKERFQKALKYYITEAKRMGLTPVLISPVETRLKLQGKAYHSRGDYPAYIRELAYQERVLFLDLNGKSYKAYKALSQEELDQKFGAIVYPNGRIDRTHFSPAGATIVAGWVKELACEKDQALCEFFILDSPL